MLTSPATFTHSSRDSNARLTAYSVYLDLIRALAAIAVLVYHIRYRFFLDYSALQPPTNRERLFYTATAFGHDAVIVFFVLSGYFISSSVIRDWRCARWSWIRYASARGVRLYLVLIPGLALTVFWDILGLSFYGSHPIYTGESTVWVHDYFPVRDRMSSRILLCNALYLQTIMAPPFGSNDALWSLAYEFWYYIIFPCFWLATVVKGWLYRTALVFVGCGILGGVGFGIAIYFPIWLLGTGACYLPISRHLQTSRHLWMVTMLSGLMFAASLIAGHTSYIRNLFGNSVIPADYLTSLGFFQFLYVLLHHTYDVCDTRIYRCVRWLAGISFTLYVVHLPLLVFLRALINAGSPWRPTFETMSLAVVLGGVTLAYAATVAAFSEIHTDRMRRFVYQILGIR